MKLKMTKTRINGKPEWHCKVGAKDFYGKTKKIVEEAVWDWMESASKDPEVALVHQQGKLRVLVSHAGSTEVKKPLANAGKYPDGIVQLTTISWTNWDILACARLVFGSLASCE